MPAASTAMFRSKSIVTSLRGEGSPPPTVEILPQSLTATGANSCRGSRLGMTPPPALRIRASPSQPASPTWSLIPHKSGFQHRSIPPRPHRSSTSPSRSPLPASLCDSRRRTPLRASSGEIVILSTIMRQFSGEVGAEPASSHFPRSRRRRWRFCPSRPTCDSSTAFGAVNPLGGRARSALDGHEKAVLSVRVGRRHPRQAGKGVDETVDETADRQSTASPLARAV